MEPDFRFSDQFVVIELHYVFGVDALETSRPINLPVTTNDEINNMFDAISYDKGIWPPQANNFHIYLKAIFFTVMI